MEQEVAEVKKQSNLVTWGPVAAVVVTVLVYFGAQLFGSILISAYVRLRGWDHATYTAWSEGVVVQFVYIAMVEGATLWLLWRFLKHRHATFKTIGLLKPKLRDIGYALAGFAMYLPLLILVTLVIKLWAPQLDINQTQQIGFSNVSNTFQLCLVFLSLVVMPPFVEEVLVRGFLYSGLKSRLPKITAILLTSVIFAVAHLQIGSGTSLVWSAALDTFILSLILIYLREVTGSLWASIGLHMIKNMIAFSVLFLFK
jgi:membrane protease YdiL (CAAX protease family)